MNNYPEKGETKIVNFNNVWTFAKAEKKLTSKLSRYWVFISLAYIISIIITFFSSILHVFGSSVSASVAILAPRFNFNSIGFYYLIIFISGIIFLAFDVRARDERERILEVLDSRPFSNLELVLGRFFGLFLSAWIPVLFLVVIIQGLGWFLPQVGVPFFSTVEPLSLFSFPVFIALPAMALSCALVFLITLIVHNRLIALFISSIAIIGLYMLSVGLTFPYAISTSLDLMGFSQAALSSDWIPSVANHATGWLQRLGLIFITIGLLFFASIIHPRLESGGQRKNMTFALLSTLVGLVLVITVYEHRSYEIEQIEQWRIAHEERVDEVIPDIITMTGDLTINPEENISLDLKLVFKAPQGSELKKALFSLNPGFKIGTVEDRQGKLLTTEFKHGLLDIKLNRVLLPGEETYINLKFRGKPNLLFGYLDSSIDIRNSSTEEAAVGILGTENAIFDNRYVALMPGIYWLPKSGVDVKKISATKTQKDFFKLELGVNVPKNWKVAGPGYRTEYKHSGDGSSTHFSPQPEITEVAILAAPFDSYSTKIDNINFEILFNPKHASNFDYLAQGKSQIELWIADKLKLARESGLVYPFKTFTLVEVPNSLRGFEGGWQMDTSMAPPSMVLMKESGLPTARFDFDPQARPLLEEEDGLSKVIRNRLIEFYSSDLTGGNVFSGIARSFFVHQTSPIGSDAQALNYTVNQLANLVLFDNQSYFSASKIAMLFQAGGNTIGGESERGKRLVDRVMLDVASEETWQKVEKIPLDNLELLENHGLTLDFLAVKSGSLAEMIYDILGPVKSGHILAEILDEHRGTAYTKKDFVAAINHQDEELGQIVNDWFENTGLAGFETDKVELFQLQDSDNGDARFQLKMQIKNNEMIDGYTRVSWSINSEGDRGRSKPFRIPARSAIEFGVVLSQPPSEVHLAPYLAYNRSDFLARRFNLADLKSRNSPPFSGVREIEWERSTEGRLVVDDLDSEFDILIYDGVESSDKTDENYNIATDEISLVSNKIFPNEWSRLIEESAWAKYRHTLTFIKPGQGDKKARFKTNIPKIGRWKLEIHLPKTWLTRDKGLGSWELKIISKDSSKSIVFDAESSIEGWNLVGEYDLSDGEVSVEFSDKTNGQGVIADAIAWSPNDRHVALNK